MKWCLVLFLLVVPGLSCEEEPERQSTAPQVRFNTKIGDIVREGSENPQVPEAPRAVGGFSGITATTLPVGVEVELAGRVEVEGRGGFKRQLIPTAKVRTAGEFTNQIGTAADGTAYRYSVGPADAGVVPVEIHLQLAGERRANVRWIVRMKDGQSSTLHSATTTGERISFTIKMDVLSEYRLEEPDATTRPGE